MNLFHRAVGALLPLVLPMTLAAQQFAGTWTVTADNGQVVTMVLRQSAGRVTGTLTIGEIELALAGSIEQGQLVGTVSFNGNTEICLAKLENGRLLLTNIPYDSEGQPDRANATDLVFTRAAGEQPAVRTPAPTPPPPRAPARSSGRAGTTDNTPVAREWADRIRGQRLYQSNRVGGGAAGGGVFERFLYICSNGRFVYRESGGVSVNVDGASGSSANRNGFEGTWRVITNQGTAVVELTHDDGEVGQFSLVHQNGGNYANGERVYITPDNNVCN